MPERDTGELPLDYVHLCALIYPRANAQGECEGCLAVVKKACSTVVKKWVQNDAIQEPSPAAEVSRDGEARGDQQGDRSGV